MPDPVNLGTNELLQGAVIAQKHRQGQILRDQAIDQPAPQPIGSVEQAGQNCGEDQVFGIHDFKITDFFAVAGRKRAMGDALHCAHCIKPGDQQESEPQPIIVALVGKERKLHFRFIEG